MTSDLPATWCVKIGHHWVEAPAWWVSEQGGCYGEAVPFPPEVDPSVIVNALKAGFEMQAKPLRMRERT